MENRQIKQNFDKNYGWETFEFLDHNTCIGTMNITFYPDTKGAFIYSISSFRKGTGTEMIHYLRDNLGVKKIEGDADPDSIRFWEKFNPNWEKDSFTIYF